MSSSAQPALEKGKVKPIPEGYHSATPYLMVRDAAHAIEYYKQVFGATELVRLVQPDGRIGHAEIKIGDSPIMLADEFPEYGNLSPQSVGGSSVVIHLYVEDADTTASRAVAAGARIRIPVKDQFYGDRSGRLVDPFGHIWIIATHREDVSAQEIQQRAETFMREHSTPAPAQEGASTASGIVKPIRQGFHTVTPYLTAPQAPELVEFVKQAFGAEELLRTTGGGGGLHTEVRIGDSMLMIGGGGAWRGTPMLTGLHLYVPDTDAVYKRALDFGATSIHEPMDQEYGERSAGVRDLAGNFWYIATHLGPTHVPQGLHTLNVYLHSRGTDRVIAFLEQALAGEEIARFAGPNGTIQHAQVRIGDTVIELGEARGQYQPMPTAFYLYVEDADALYARAVEAGATSVQPPTDQPFGDRNALVKDPFGNHWYIATHIEDVPLT